MATAGISRSGRVRRKSAKLLDMVTESTPQQNSNDINKNTNKLTPNVSHNSIGIVLNSNPTEEMNNKSDSDSGPPKKKLKLRLCLNPSPAITSEEKPIESEANSEPKKSMIPVLKIPKSKITGLVPNICTENQNNLNESEANSVTNHSVSEDIKTKSIKNESSVEMTTKSEEIESIEAKPSLNESITPAVETPKVKVEDKSIELSVEKPIEVTPKVCKVVKPKKKEQESAANKLFRQITSGVAATTPKGKGNRKGKTQPLEDMNQISFDEFPETSLIIETEDVVKPKPKPKNKRSRPSKALNVKQRDEMTKKNKRGKKDGDDKPKKKRNAVITAYMIWSKEHRSKIQQNCPDLDFADVSRKLGEIWQSMPEKEKIPWRRKAQKLIATGSSIISTGKQKASPRTVKQNNIPLVPGSPPSFNDDLSNYGSLEDLWEPVSTSPVDVSAHLTLLGESLSIIGQRLKEHSGQIAVSGSLSVLLDSTLCAIGPLLCLTQLHPSLNGCSEEMHKKTLDNIAYIMPGI